MSGETDDHAAGGWAAMGEDDHPVDGAPAGLTPEETVRLLIGNSSEAVFRARNGVIEWISPRIADIVGWTPRDLIGRTTVHLWHPDDVGDALAIREGAARGEVVHRCLRLRHRDGHFVWVNARMGPAGQCAKPGAVAGSVRLADDGDAREKWAADLERSYQQVAENARDIIWTVDMAGIVLHVTPSVETVLGWHPDDLIDTFAPSLVHPDDRSRLAAYRREVQAGSPPERLEIRAQARGGAWRWMSVSATPVDAGDGAPTTVVSWRDIHDLVLEREIAERETERLRAVLDSSLDPRVMLQAVRDDAGQIVDFRYEDANTRACAYMGMSRERLLGRRLLDVFPGVREAGFLDGYIRAVEEGVPFEVDDVAYSNEIAGATLRYDIRAHAVGDSLMYAWRDVTARSKAADESAHAAMHFRDVAQYAGDAVLRVENDTITWTSGSGNPLLQVLPGTPPDDVLRALRGGRDDGHEIDRMHATPALGVPYGAVWQLTGADAREHAVLVRAQAIGAGIDPRTDIIITMIDVSAARAGDGADAEMADLMARWLDS